MRKLIVILMFLPVIGFGQTEFSRTWARFQDITNTRYFIWHGDTINFDWTNDSTSVTYTADTLFIGGDTLVNANFVPLADSLIKWVTLKQLIDSIAAIPASHVAVTLNASATEGGLSINDQELGFQSATDARNGYLKSTDYVLFFNKISRVSHDETMTGYGTEANPLSCDTAMIATIIKVQQMIRDTLDNLPGDDWGNDVVIHDGTISGTGTISAPLMIDSTVFSTRSWVILQGYLATNTGDWTGTFDGQEGTYYLNYNNLSNKPTIPVISDIAYGASWNNNLDGATKNAIYDKIESLPGGHNAATVSATMSNGLAINGQELSLGLAGSGSTGALSSTDWNTFNSMLDAEVDGSITNELQNLGYDAATRSLTITQGSGVILPTFSTNPGLVNGGSGISAKFLRGDNTWQTVITTEVDGSITNELQNLSYLEPSRYLQITGGTGVTFPLFSSTNAGLVPGSNTTTTTYFLCADGTWKIPASSGMTNVLQYTGDMIYSSLGTYPARLPIGSTDQVLTVSGGLPTWQTVADNSATNELQNISYNSATRSLTITQGTGTTIPLFSNSDAGLVNGGSGISSKFLRGDNTWQNIVVTEVDGSVTNEIQTLSASGTSTPVISLSLNGGSVTLTSTGITTLSNSNGVININSTEVDGSNTNELQNVSYNSTLRTVSITNGTGFTFPGFDISGADYGLVRGSNGAGSTYFLNGNNQWVTLPDYSATNELQSLGYDAATRSLTITNGTGVYLPLFSTTGTTPGLVPGSNSATTSYYLRSDGSWAIPSSSGMPDPMLQRGDMIARDADNQTTRIPIGVNGYVLTSNGTVPSWQPVADNSATNEIELPLQTGNSGKYLKTNGSTTTWAAVDTSITNELQNLSYSTASRTVSISNGTTTAIIPFFNTVTEDAGLVKGSSGGGTNVFLNGTGNWSVPSGSGNVSKVGTQVAQRVAVWSGDGTVKGYPGLTFDTLKLTTNQLFISNPTAGNADYDKFLVLDPTGTEVKYRTGTQLLSDIGAQGALTTGTLTETVPGLQFDNTRAVIGGGATLSLTAGYVIPTTSETASWTTAYSHVGSDNDLSSTNELQSLSYTASTRVIGITGAGVSSTTLPLFSTNSTNAGLVPGSNTTTTTYFLRADGAWGIPAGSGVTSVFGRTGNVVAQTGDYTASQVTNAADKTAFNVFTASQQGILASSPYWVTSNSNASSSGGGLLCLDENGSNQFAVGYNNNTNECYMWGFNNNPIKFGINNSEYGRWTTTGLVVTGTVIATNVGLGSDKRLKHNIHPLKGLDWVDKIEFKKFQMKYDTTNRVRYGVIAQELAEVAPELVYTDDKGFKSVAYVDLLMLITARQREQIEDLTKRIEKLEKLIGEK